MLEKNRRDKAKSKALIIPSQNIQHDSTNISKIFDISAIFVKKLQIIFVSLDYVINKPYLCPNFLRDYLYQINLKVSYSSCIELRPNINLRINAFAGFKKIP